MTSILGLEEFSVFSDDDLMELNLFNDLKSDYKLALLKNEKLNDKEFSRKIVEVEKDKKLDEDALKILNGNIDLFVRKTKKLYGNEKPEKNDFKDIKKLFKQTKLTKFLFEYHVEDNYGILISRIVEEILDENQEKKKFDYDQELILNILLNIFKKKFHEDMQNCYLEFISELNGMEKNAETKEKKFFEEKNYISVILKIFKNSDDNEKSENDNIHFFFYKLSKILLENRLLKLVELMFDICSIQLDDDDVNLFISMPLISDINDDCTSDNEKINDRKKKPSFFSHFWHKKHPLYKIRNADDDNLLSHDLVFNVVQNQWNNLKWIFFFEYILYLAFLVFFSLNSLRLSKEYSIPYEFKWVCLSILFVLILIEMIEFSVMGIYYIYLFSKIFEILNFALVLVALFASETNLPNKSGFYAVSLLSTYLCLIFRSEKNFLFGTYIYTFRKILFKSFKVVPIVFVMYFCFYLSLRSRSRYITEPDQEHDDKEISFNDKFLSHSIIKLSGVLLGNFELDEFGLGEEGATGETFTNFFLINLMIYLLPVFLFNLFIGIAVDEVSDLLRKGQLHLIKIRIDYILKLFYIFNFFKIKKYFSSFYGNIFYFEYIWIIKNKRLLLYRFRKYLYLMIRKLTNSKFTFNLTKTETVFVDSKKDNVKKVSPKKTSDISVVEEITNESV